MHNKLLLTCKQCGKRFFTEGEKEFYIKHNLSMPKRCKSCRNKNKTAKSQEIIQIPNNIKYNVMNIKDFTDKITQDALYIIGNGFDLLHNVKSSYYNFRNSLGSWCYLKDCLEIYINKTDIWGDFEDSLAHIDRAMVLEGLDTSLDIFEVKDEFDEDFSAADYFLAIENTTNPVDTITEELPKKFRRWVEKLTADNKHLPLKNLLNHNADYINFNYTEFLETLYGINPSKINYIHGDRRNKKEVLVLGHGYDTNELYEIFKNSYNPKFFPKNSPQRLGYFCETDNIKRWKSQSRYDAAMASIYRIEEYFENSAKKTNDVINKNQAYFKSLSDKNSVIIIGHSLSKVDYPYFIEIIKNHNNYKNINWYISFYTANDHKRIEKFANFMNIDNEKLKLFQLKNLD